MSGPFLFMGEQPDPEMDVAIGRGIPRIYDGTADEPETPLEPDPSQHGTHFRGPCVCGRALFDARCMDPLFPAGPAPRPVSERES